MPEELLICDHCKASVSSESYRSSDNSCPICNNKLRKYSNAEKLQKEEAELVKRCKREYPLNMAPVFYVLAIIAFLMLLRSLFSNNIYFTKYSFPGIIFIFSLFCLGIGYVFSHINYKSKFLLDEKIKKEIEHLREKYNNPPES